MFFILNSRNPPGRIVYFFNAKILKNPIIQILLSIIFPKTQKINSRKNPGNRSRRRPNYNKRAILG